MDPAVDTAVDPAVDPAGTGSPGCPSSAGNPRMITLTGFRGQSVQTSHHCCDWKFFCHSWTRAPLPTTFASRSMTMLPPP